MTPWVWQDLALTRFKGQKLKRRLEDLERRALSTSASPEPAQKQKQQRPSHSRAKSGNALPSKSSWGNAKHSSTPSLRRSVSSPDEDSTLSHYGYGLPSPAVERSATSSYSLYEQTATASYSRDPWYQNNPTSSYAESYQAWNAPTSTPLYKLSPTLTHIKEEDQEYNLSYTTSDYANTISLSGSESYQGSSSQPYVMPPPHQSTAPSLLLSAHLPLAATEIASTNKMSRRLPA